MSCTSNNAHRARYMQTSEAPAAPVESSGSSSPIALAYDEPPPGLWARFIADVSSNDVAVDEAAPQTAAEVDDVQSAASTSASNAAAADASEPSEPNPQVEKVAKEEQTMAKADADADAAARAETADTPPAKAAAVPEANPKSAETAVETMPKFVQPAPAPEPVTVSASTPAVNDEEGAGARCVAVHCARMPHRGGRIGDVLLPRRAPCAVCACMDQ